VLDPDRVVGDAADVKAVKAAATTSAPVITAVIRMYVVVMIRSF
jgi:hypothetical protein